MSGKCPKCDHIVQEARLAHMNISDGTLRLKAFSSNCPACGVTLGVVLDPRPTDNNLQSIIKAVGAK
jgi:hypothetical protein